MNTTDPTPDSTGSPAARPAETTGENGRRLVGTRSCLHCHHELGGQPISRIEPEGLLVVRCTECGRATPILEYPVLGRWGARLGSTLILLHMLIAFGIVTMTSVVSFAIALNITRGSHRDLREFIRSKWKVYQADVSNLTAPIDYLIVDRSWWNQAGPEVLEQFQAQFGLVIGTLSFWELGGFVLLTSVFGVLWAGLFAGVRWTRLWIAPVVLYFVALGLGMSATPLGDGPTLRIYDISESIRMRHIFPMALTAALLGLEIGMLMGRPLLRIMTHLLLPPSRRHDIDFLWRVDKKR